ncbi:MAG: hypothetical protein II791_02635 [Bacteroidales bacterium]|nr:hypothetical protein [Bacteroidales bacterium]
MRKSLLCIALFIAALFPLMGQSDDLGLGGNTDRLGGVFHSYEAAPGPQTPAPRGFKPVYVSHYGRHGSRRQIGGGGTEAYKYFLKASEADVLTEEGKALYKDLEVLYGEHNGMDGELTIRGGIEHKGVSQRMYERFKPAFKGKKAVHCQSSTIQRCLLSMANFTSQLKGNAPSLDFDFITGKKYFELLCRGYYAPDQYKERSSFLSDSLVHALFDPSRIMSAFFTDSPKVKEVVPDPWRLGRYLYLILADCQDLKYETGGLELYKYFTEEELTGLAKFSNETMYASMGNNADWGDNIIWAQKWLVEDIVTRADKALADGNVAADLRFGHDSAIMPLAGLLGLDGVGRRFKVGEAWKNGHYMWEVVPMCTNLQMAFYRNRKGEVLVKMLYNEKERTIAECFIPGVSIPAPVTGPYYKWEDLRTYLIDISKNKEFGK